MLKERRKAERKERAKTCTLTNSVNTKSNLGRKLRVSNKGVFSQILHFKAQIKKNNPFV